MSVIRHSSLLPALAVSLVAVLATAGCAASGGLGQVPTTPPSAAPSIDAGPSDETPAPFASPTTGASGSPSGAPAASSSPSTPTETMIVRAYYVLGGAPGVTGLVPTLRVVPKTSGVARSAMEALLDSGTIT